MNHIHRQVLHHILSGTRIVWATVIRSSGSTPQKPGSSAIFYEGGLLSGTVGGGVMEADTGALAALRLNDRYSNLYHFNLDGDQGKEGAICGGEAEVLLDADPALNMRALEKLDASVQNRQGGILITTVGKERDQARSIERYWIRDDDLTQLPEQFQPLAREVLDSQSRPYQTSGLRTTELKDQESSLYELVFVEFINPLPRLVIAGAGHLGRALSHLGKILDFEVTVIDDRPEYANSRNLPDADHIVGEDIGRSMAALDPDPDTYCVIVTRGHHHDGEALRPLIGSDAAYVGMIGSHHKVAVMKKRFLDKGWATREQWDQIHAPVGIPIGSQTVQEIAVSIAAQLVEIRNKKLGKNGK